MRRQTQPQGLAARWQPVPLDVNPFQLPARFNLSVKNAPGQALTDWDHIIVSPGMVTIDRDVPGLGRCRSDHAIEDFSGISVRMEACDESRDTLAVTVNLHHEDPALCLPLFVAFDLDVAGARWQSWGRVLGLPLLVPAPDGTWQEAIDRLGKLSVNRAYPREARLSLKSRRSMVALSRRVGMRCEADPLPGKEIIARN